MDTLSFKLFRAAVHEAIARHDPIGLIELGAPNGEYDPELSTILPRLAQCNDVDEVLEAVHSEFKAWFGALTAGRRAKYRTLAGELFRLSASGSTERKLPSVRDGHRRLAMPTRHRRGTTRRTATTATEPTAKPSA